VISRRMPDESNDSVHLLVSLLVRHPELSRVVIKPRFAGLAFFFVVRARLSLAERRSFRRSLLAHLRALHRLQGVRGAPITVRFTYGEGLTFIDVERDAKSLAPEEIATIVGVVAQTFGEQLLVNPPADESDEDRSPQDDPVGSALEAVRHGKQRKGLVAFREERRVLVYFGK
jgi:hypothetical protein